VVLDGPELARPLLLVHRTPHAVSTLAVHELDTGALVTDLDLPPCSAVGSVASGGLRRARGDRSNSHTCSQTPTYQSQTG
jgi:prolyl oligopeptidase